MKTKKNILLFCLLSLAGSKADARLAPGDPWVGYVGKRFVCEVQNNAVSVTSIEIDLLQNYRVDVRLFHADEITTNYYHLSAGLVWSSGMLAGPFDDPTTVLNSSSHGEWTPEIFFPLGRVFIKHRSKRAIDTNNYLFPADFYFRQTTTANIELRILCKLSTPDIIIRPLE